MDERSPQRGYHLFWDQPKRRYDFGGGTTYARAEYPVVKAHCHDIHVAMQHTLTGMLSGNPFVYTVAVTPSYFSNGEHIGRTTRSIATPELSTRRTVGN